MVPLDKLDLQRMSIIYTTGDMAAVTPVYNYNFHVIAYEASAGAGGEGWRSLLFWLGVPGLVIAGLMAASVQEPRQEQQRQQKQRQQKQQQKQAGAPPAAKALPASGAASEGDDATSVSSSTTTSSSDGGDANAAPGGAARLLAAARGGGSAIGGLLGRVTGGGAAAASAPEPAAAAPAMAAASAAPAAAGGAAATALALPAPPGTVEAHGGALAPVKELLGMRAFQATTLAAALNDLGSYALIAWHSTFYERVFGLDSSVYAPMLAVILPVGGIVGGVGGGLIADVLSTVGGRYWLTSGGRRGGAAVPDSCWGGLASLAGVQSSAGCGCTPPARSRRVRALSSPLAPRRRVHPGGALHRVVPARRLDVRLLPRPAGARAGARAGALPPAAHAALLAPAPPAAWTLSLPPRSQPLPSPHAPAPRRAPSPPNTPTPGRLCHVRGVARPQRHHDPHHRAAGAGLDRQRAVPLHPVRPGVARMGFGLEAGARSSRPPRWLPSSLPATPC
jgi:hypothetical protein